MTSHRRKPRKPSQPLGKIVFPKMGSPRKVIESLPASADLLEETVIRKFLGALQRFHGLGFSKPTRGAPWPDFEVFLGPIQVGIEVTELVNIEHQRFRATQAHYLPEILRLLEGTLPRLAGLHITIYDGYQYPPFPTIASKEGRSLALFIASRIGEAAPALEAVLVGCFFACTWEDAPASRRLGVYGHRSAPASQSAEAVLQFFPSFPDSIESLGPRLRDTIARKMASHYTAYPRGPLWLLVYEVGSMSIRPDDPPSLSPARELLSNQSQFSEVWYFYPYPEEDAGHIIRIWPEANPQGA